LCRFPDRCYPARDENTPPTRFDAIRLRLEAAECYRRAGTAETAVAKARFDELARELVRLSDKAERGDEVPSPEDVAGEVAAVAQSGVDDPPPAAESGSRSKRSE
jgi:hypothetical protein